MGKRGPPKGRPLAEDHLHRMYVGRMNSPAFKQHLANLHALNKGKPPSLKSIAGSMASKTLRRMSLNRLQAPELWQEYSDFYLGELKLEKGIPVETT